MTLIELLDFVEKRPLMYLKTKKLEELEAFLGGYKLCQSLNKIKNKEDESLYENFNNYLQFKYNLEFDQNWYKTILNVAERRRLDPFDTFYIELNEFKSKHKQQ